MSQLSKMFLFFFLFYSSLFASSSPKKCVNGKYYINMHLGGRLGNQMFQVAAALSLAEDVGAQAIFPDFVLKSGDNLPENHKFFFSSLLTVKPHKPSTYMYEEHPHFHFSPIPFQPNMEICGYFQSESYFRHNKEKICSFFEPSTKIKEYLATKYHALLEHPNTVAIHMRAYRIENPDIERCFPLLDGEFFMKAANLFPKDALFVIFSDKIDWAKDEMKTFDRPHIFIENETQFHDLYLMSFCKHQILSTSSFSWWGAYLNKNPDKIVLAPYPWFSPISGHDSSHVIPKEWHAISWQ